ncbi:sporulation membrane protein YtaF [Geosporobacter ferrireducens]|uniref:Sporulation membrane protein YtaF n=1 Tax=Geosporobacter ferrireducens TaxID=1424294 RepID=A0A1D8GJ89_9FIRM|nr:sporulation membrane protein YtaF [Geosporobacter ferrireducens]AOT70970.1 sporulation membrane protein YtaF [Geosporobacter ferrireducens]
MFIYPILLAISISIDTFGIGVTYGMKRIKVPFQSLLLINMVSVLSLFIAFALGNLLLTFITVFQAKLISSSLVLLLGFFFLIQAYLDCRFPAKNGQKMIKKISIKALGIVINIIRDPISGDSDHSGTIEPKEAMYIGVALAVDAFTIGVAISIIKIHMLSFIAAIFIINILFFRIGEFLGKKIGHITREHILKYISATILIFLGLIRLI